MAHLELFYISKIYKSSPFDTWAIGMHSPGSVIIAVDYPAYALQGGSFLLGHRLLLFKEPSGHLYRTWQREIPNDGIIRYFDVFNTETILPLSSKALAEVLVHKAYDFIKPPQLTAGIGQIIGIGIFLAEGDEHKVGPFLNLARTSG